MSDREDFEGWYSEHAFNYSRDPIGSRDCSLQWDAWRAAIASVQPEIDALQKGIEFEVNFRVEIQESNEKYSEENELLRAELDVLQGCLQTESGLRVQQERYTDHLLDELNALKAEREETLRQVPVAYRSEDGRVVNKSAYDGMFHSVKNSFGMPMYAKPMPPAIPEGLSDDVIDMITKAMRRSWQLGQTYWQQADSESYSQNRKSSKTQEKFNTLISDTIAAAQKGGV